MKIPHRCKRAAPLLLQVDPKYKTYSPNDLTTLAVPHHRFSPSFSFVFPSVLFLYVDETSNDVNWLVSVSSEDHDRFTVSSVEWLADCFHILPHCLIKSVKHHLLKLCVSLKFHVSSDLGYHYNRQT